MSDADDTVRRLAIEQRKRLVATILGCLESGAFPHLPRPEQKEIRDKIVGAINVYHDFILDLIKVNRDDFVRSDEAVRILRQVRESQMRMEKARG